MPRTLASREYVSWTTRAIILEQKFEEILGILLIKYVIFGILFPCLALQLLLTSIKDMVYVFEQNILWLHLVIFGYFAKSPCRTLSILPSLNYNKTQMQSSIYL